MSVLLVNSNSLRVPLANKSVHMIATSPPYWGLRDYGTARWDGGDPECDHAAAQIRTGKGLAALGEKYRGGGHKQGQITHIQFRDVCQKCGAVRLDEQLGLEPIHDCNGWATGDECGRCYVCHMVQVFRELWRVLRDDGAVWLNLGDSYVGATSEYAKGGSAGKNSIRGKRSLSGMPSNGRGERGRTGLPMKNLVGIPWRVALALQADGWYLRSDVIWSKPNPMPESVTDRPTKAHEYVFLLAKSEKYFYDHEAIKEPVQESSIKRISQPTFDQQPGGEKDYRNGINSNRSMRQTLENFRSAAKRTKRDSFKREGSKREQVIPGQSMGTHRPNREESDWDLSARNKRTVWTVSTKPYPGSHFATWPPDLVEPMIKAGTSEAGCCPECGKPWKRIVAKGEPSALLCNPNPVRPYTAESNHRQGMNGSTLHMSRETLTLGWEPGCKCRSAAAMNPVPCIVLDPFAGSGTTVMVARQLGRHGIGLDLSFDYLQSQARPRLQLDQLEQWESGSGKKDEASYESLPLFMVNQ